MGSAGLSAVNASCCEENDSPVFVKPHTVNTSLKNTAVSNYHPFIFQVRKWLPLQRRLNCSVVAWLLFSCPPPPSLLGILWLKTSLSNNRRYIEHRGILLRKLMLSILFFHKYKLLWSFLLVVGYIQALTMTTIWKISFVWSYKISCLWKMHSVFEATFRE